MKQKISKQILSLLMAMVMLVGLLPTAAVPVFAAVIGDRDTISSVAITVDQPIAGQPLSTCVPETTLCQIACTWSVRGLKGITEIPASTIAEEGKTYYLAMVLTPKLDLYTFAASVTGTVNGNTVTVERMSGTKVACMVPITPKTKAGTVDVSVPQPAYGATPGTPTAAGGRTVTDYSWYRNHPTGLYDRIELGEGDVFSGSYTYWMEATVKAASDEVFDENTTVTVNGQVTTILSRDPEANTITFRYDVAEIINVAANIYVPDGNGGSWYLTHGDTRTNAAGTYTASYVSGVLTLTNTGNSTVSGFYQIPDRKWYTGIYADNPLTVRFEGDFSFNLGSVPEDAAYVYGIYVLGDLTIINGVSAADRTVSFVPAEGTLATHGSSGIYCDPGGLTVKNESQKGFTLNAHGVGVRLVDGRVSESANFTNHGIYAKGSIDIGDNCTVNATAADVALSSWGTTTSRGIYCDRDLTIGENAVVTVTGGNINPSQSATNFNLGNYQYCYGVQTWAGDITVNGGTLIVSGGNIDYGTITGAGNMGLGQECYGIYCNDSITLNGGTITATAGYSRANAFVESSLSKGIFCSNLTVSAGTLTAIANDAWLESTGLWVQGVLNQTGGTITGTGGVAVCLQGSGTGSRGVYVAITLTASGGSLTGTGGTMGIQQPSVGLQAGTIALSGTAQVTGFGGLTTRDPIETPVTGESTFASYPGDSIGVWTFDDLTVDGNAVLTATGGTVRGNNYSSAEAMSIGLEIIADDVTISGSGKIVATGGETHYGGKGKNYSDSSCGIFGETSSLTIDGTNVIATGGDVSTKTVSGGGVVKGGVSYGLNLPGSSLTLQNGAELIATGGDNPTYSDNYTQKSQTNNSYGAYVGGDITVTDSVLTATGGLSIRTVGLYNGGAVTLNGMNSRLTATADDYYDDAPGTGSEVYCYGAMNGDGSNPGGAYTVNGGVLLLQGQELAMSYKTNSTLTAAAILRSNNLDGSNAVSQKSPANFSAFYTSKYVKADSSNVVVTINDWTYGDSGWDPNYTTYEGTPTFLWTGTTNAGASYSAATAPTDAGSYTVTVTYPGGQTGSADFTVAPRAITACEMSLSPSIRTYNGEEQTVKAIVSYLDKELVEGTDYTLSGNTGTNVGTYTVTITGIGNFTGTTSLGFRIQKKYPTAADFNIPVIGEYAYTGERVELPLPTLKEPYTGGGTVSVYYNGVRTPPMDIGEYTVTFNITEGTNFSYADNIEYGTLVIKAADISAIALHDLDAPQVGKAPDTKVSSAYPALYSVLNVRWLDEEDAEVNSFEEGKFYTVEITVSATYIGDGSGNRFNFADSVTASIDGIAVTGEGSSVTVNDDDTVTIRYKFPEAAAVPTGVTVSGTVTSFGSETDDITIELYAEGSATAAYTATVKGKTAAYAIEGVATGTYTMKVTKAGHEVYTDTVTVEGRSVEKNVTLAVVGITVNCIGTIGYTVSGNVVTVDHDGACKVGYLDGTAYKAITAVAKGDGTYFFTAPAGVTQVLLVVKGDATGDGAISLADSTRTKAAYNKKVTLSAEALFAADASSDGSVTLADSTRIKAAYNKKTTLSW